MAIRSGTRCCRLPAAAGRARPGIRVAKEQVAAWPKMPAQPCSTAFCVGLSKYISTLRQNTMSTSRSTGYSAAIRFSRANCISAAQFGDDADQRFRLVAAAQHVARAQLRRHRGGGRRRVDAARRHLQHLGAQIGAEDRHARRRGQLAPQLGQHHRQRIGLGAGRAGGAPHFQLAAPARPAAPATRCGSSRSKCCGSRKNSVLFVVTASISATASLCRPSSSNRYRHTQSGWQPRFRARAGAAGLRAW